LFKTFLIGIVLGAAVAAGLLYAVPAVDQEREASIMSVAPNGGTIERFHINIPMDRVAAGAPSDASLVPPGLEWPTEPLFSNLRSELFKIRDADDVVVGVAVRTAAKHGEEDVVDWLLHLPARGSLFVSLDALPSDNGARIGKVVSGTREFANLRGSLGERWYAYDSDEGDGPLGRIELRASYISELEPLKAAEGEE
jgi:hypothetical protein